MDPESLGTVTLYHTLVRLLLHPSSTGPYPLPGRKSAVDRLGSREKNEEARTCVKPCNNGYCWLNGPFTRPFVYDIFFLADRHGPRPTLTSHLHLTVFLSLEFLAGPEQSQDLR